MLLVGLVIYLRHRPILLYPGVMDPSTPGGLGGIDDVERTTRRIPGISPMHSRVRVAQGERSVGKRTVSRAAGIPSAPRFFPMQLDLPMHRGWAAGH